jgi:hypothetical protein
LMNERTLNSVRNSSFPAIFCLQAVAMRTRIATRVRDRYAFPCLRLHQLAGTDLGGLYA